MMANGTTNDFLFDDIEPMIQKIQSGPDFYSVQDLANLFGYNRRTIYRKIIIGNIPGLQLGPKRSTWRIPKSCLINFINVNCCRNKEEGF